MTHPNVEHRAHGKGLAHEADFALGLMRVRPSLGEVEIEGEKQHLEPRVMQVLVALVRARGAVLSRDDLIASCWDGVIVGDDAINRVISKVRHLAEDERARFHVETLPRIGYRLTDWRSRRWRIAGRDGAGSQALVGGLIALSLVLAIALVVVIVIDLRA